MDSLKQKQLRYQNSCHKGSEVKIISGRKGNVGQIYLVWYIEYKYRGIQVGVTIGGEDKFFVSSDHIVFSDGRKIEEFYDHYKQEYLIP